MRSCSQTVVHGAGVVVGHKPKPPRALGIWVFHDNRVHDGSPRAEVVFQGVCVGGDVQASDEQLTVLRDLEERRRDDGRLELGAGGDTCKTRLSNQSFFYFI